MIRGARTSIRWLDPCSSEGGQWQDPGGSAAGHAHGRIVWQVVDPPKGRHWLDLQSGHAVFVEMHYQKFRGGGPPISPPLVIINKGIQVTFDYTLMVQYSATHRVTRRLRRMVES